MAGPTKPRKPGASVDTLAFTESLGLQTFRHGSRRIWPKEDDARLLARIEQLYPAEYAENTLKAHDIDWDTVVEVFAGERKSKDCKKRWASSLDPNLRRGKWDAEEDALLVRQFQKYGTSWQQVALGIEGRTEHQCLKRYYEVLDPSVRNRLEPWTEHEDLVLIELVTVHGTKWKTVSNEIPGRPLLTCRNRWRNLVTAVVRGRASPAVVEKMAAKFEGDPDALVRSAGTEPGSLQSALLAAKAGTGDGPVGAESDLSPVSNSSASVCSPAGMHSRNGVRQSLGHHVNAGASDAMNAPNAQKGVYGGAGPSNHMRPMGSPAHTQSHTQTPMPTLQMAAKPSWQNQPALRQNLHLQQSHAAPPPLPLASEWKYNLAGSLNVPDNDPLRALLAFGGNIHSEQLANYLVQCAAQFSLLVNIHHHHHYAPTQPDTAAAEGPAENGSLREPQSHPVQQDLPGFAHLHQEVTGLPYLGMSPGPADTDVDPEVSLSRFQHFNYLPPLTPVPRLQSSASSPANPENGAGDHNVKHYSHIHYHQLNQNAGQEDGHANMQQSAMGPEAAYDANDFSAMGAPEGMGQDASNKGPDVFRMLNVAHMKLECEPTSRSDQKALAEDVRSRSLTPLTQAVQMATAPDAATAYYKRAADDLAMAANKRTRFENIGNEGYAANGRESTPLDFFVPHDYDQGWETHGNGNGNHASVGSHENEHMGGQFLHQNPGANVEQAVQPVSQHHPLHHLSSAAKGANDTSQSVFEEEEEECFDSWGFYPVHDKPQQPLELSDESNLWFPFNPS